MSSLGLVSCIAKVSGHVLPVVNGKRWVTFSAVQ